MTREEIIKSIYMGYNCQGNCADVDMPCKECIEKQLAEHENQIYTKGYNDGIARQRLNCDVCFYKLSIESGEYEKQIRAEVIDSFVNECVQYEDLTFNKEHIERIKLVAEQLKGE